MPDIPKAERRQITVLSCDWESPASAAASKRHQTPNDACPSYQEICRRMTQRFDGHVTQASEDRFQAYFGDPLANEDNALRAVRAGLAILKALSGSDQIVRIGIYTSWALLSAQQQRLTLDTAQSLEVRLGMRSCPQTLVICATTCQQVRDQYICEPFQAHFLAKLPSTQPIYYVQDDHPPAPDNEATRRTLLAGRQQEISLVLERWELVKDSLGQVFLIQGEAGIGKSRLIHTIKEHLEDEPYTLLEFRCSPYDRHSALYPIIDFWQRVLCLSPNQPSIEKLSKLETLLTRYGLELHDTVPIFAALLALSLPPDRYPPVTLTPEQQKRKTLACLLTCVLELSRQKPVLLVVEDLHWIDPSTLEFLRLLVDQAPTIRLLALFTCRSEFDPLWDPRGHLLRLTLGRLSRHDAAQMLMSLTSGKPLPAEVSHMLLTKTDGVPLFVEALAKTVLESHWLQEAEDHYRLTGPLPSLTIPTTLQDSLMARLDRLDSAKPVAQLGAMLGRSFSYVFLQAVSTHDAPALQRALDRLVDAEILHVQGLPPDQSYTFKHALIQDAAQRSLLKHTKQAFHQRIAKALVTHFADTLERQPELVAHHYTEAGMAEDAIPYWQRAGVRAASRSACLEALVHLNKGLSLLRTLPDTPERIQQELDIQTILGPTLMAVKSPVDPEVEAAYARARELCRKVGTTPKQVWALEGLWAFYLVRGKFDIAEELAHQLLGLADGLQNPLAFAVAHQTLGVIRLYFGDLTLALNHLEEGAAHYALQQRRSPVLRGVHDPGVMCHAFAALVLCLQGKLDQAALRIHNTLQLAQELTHPYSLGFAYCAAAVTHQFRTEIHETLEQAETAIRLSTEQSFPLWSAMGEVLRGWAMARQGRTIKGIEGIHRGITTWRAAGAQNIVPYYLVLLAEAHEKAGDVKAALRVLDEALVMVETTGERWWEAETLRLRGKFLLMQATPDEIEAEACFRQALHVAQQQGAKLWELRIVASWSRLLHMQGKREDAQRLLYDMRTKPLQSATERSVSAGRRPEDGTGPELP